MMLYTFFSVPGHIDDSCEFFYIILNWVHKHINLILYMFKSPFPYNSYANEATLHC